ncbi:hypothetical protein [Anaerotruncus rubiinfantis]|uniref:hypothetical protein n=1 Tax=Anaerotruncus rubiinfantis TaxID=1720200 RepID=UPI0018997450|nr:hypothetical protein [Anaerotruncus rubiinfantis]
MSTVIKKHILYLLEHYNQMRAEIDTLKFELKNLNRMRDVEMIEALTFSSSLKERVDTSETTNKTADIALSYQEKLEKLRHEAQRVISARLSELSTEIDRLDFYIGKLPPFETAVLREYYIENYSWRELQDLKGVSAKTLIRHRDEAIRRLDKMYEPLEKMGLLNKIYT